MNEKRISIKMTFEEDEAKKFNAVKKVLGLSANTEVIRALISKKFEEIKDKDSETVKE